MVGGLGGGFLSCLVDRFPGRLVGRFRSWLGDRLGGNLGDDLGGDLGGYLVGWLLGCPLSHLGSYFLDWFPLNPKEILILLNF